MPPRFSACTLMAQGEAVLMRKDHPASVGKLTMKAFSSHPLVAVSVGGNEEGAVDGFILERGLARQSEMFDRSALSVSLAAMGAEPRVRITVPHALAVPALLRDSDMLSIVPNSLARALTQRDSSLVMRRLPYDSGTAVTRSVWHARHEHDAGHIWLRDLVRNVARTAGAR